MPERAGVFDPREFFRDLDRRIEDAARIYFRFESEEVQQRVYRVWPWQSADPAVTGQGHAYFADTDGYIHTVQAFNPLGDGVTDAEFDVFHNGVSIFTGSLNRPTVPAGEQVGMPVAPKAPELGRFRFKQGDEFIVEILDTGGASSLLRVTIAIMASIPKVVGE